MEILNVRYDNLTLDIAVERALELARGQDKASIFFLNIDCLNKAQSDKEYLESLKHASLVLPDGIGLKLATILFGGRMRDNCNGTDLSPVLMEKAAAEGLKLFFLGGCEGIAEKAAENISKKIPAIKITGTSSGYFNNDDHVIDKINGSGAEMLFVALGVPLQEKWIVKNRDRLNPKLCLGVGALLDYLSGRIKRAPKFMRTIHLEWLWRIFIDPRRMFKRYIVDGAGFFIYLLFYRFRKTITQR